MQYLFKKKVSQLVGLFYDKSFIKFLLVGIINTFFGILIMYLLYNLFHISYWLSTSIAYILSSIVSYFLNKYYTFGNKKTSVKEIIYFILNIAICYLIAYGVAKPLSLYLLDSYSKAVQENTAMLIGMVIFTGLNYLSQRFIVFKKV